MSITLRRTKGAVLTHEELDNNFEELSGGASELEKITENSKTGWRLKGWENDYASGSYHTDIGAHALDLTYGSYYASCGAGGNCSHAEGAQTLASGFASHTEGYYATASGYASHAEGTHTIALNVASHAAGTYNIGTATDTIHETGIGTNPGDKKNAFEIYTDGRIAMPNLPTADPGPGGFLWNDSGVFKITPNT